LSPSIIRFGVIAYFYYPKRGKDSTYAKEGVSIEPNAPLL